MTKPDKLKPLPFSFAKRKGVLIHEEESPPKRRQLIFRESLDLAVFAEVQRFCSAEVVPKRVDAEGTERITVTSASSSAVCTLLVA